MLFTDPSGTKKNLAKDPAVVKWLDKYYLYYSVFLPDENGREVLGIGIAVSDDMENWVKTGNFPLTQPCESNGIGAPAAIVLDGAVHLFYQTYGNWTKDAICHAVSSDGIHFEKDGTNPIFKPSETWCCGRAIDADVCVFGDKLYLYFATRDHEAEIQKVGVASAPLGSGFGRGAWTECVAQSVVAPEFRWEGKCVEAPAALENGGKVWLFYGGSYNCTPQQIGVAVSDDGVFFKKLSKEPFLRCGNAGSWNASESGHPYIFRDDDGSVWLFYQGSPDGGESWYISKTKVDFSKGYPALENLQAAESGGAAVHTDVR